MQRCLRPLAPPRPAGPAALPAALRPLPSLRHRRSVYLVVYFFPCFSVVQPDAAGSFSLSCLSLDSREKCVVGRGGGGRCGGGGRGGGALRGLAVGGGPSIDRPLARCRTSYREVCEGGRAGAGMRWAGYRHPLTAGLRDPRTGCPHLLPTPYPPRSPSAAVRVGLQRGTSITLVTGAFQPASI